VGVGFGDGVAVGVELVCVPDGGGVSARVGGFDVGEAVGFGRCGAKTACVPCGFGVDVAWGFGFLVTFGFGVFFGVGVADGDAVGFGVAFPPPPAPPGLQMIVNVPASPKSMPPGSRIETVNFGPGGHSAAVATALEPLIAKIINGPPAEPALRNAIAAGFPARVLLFPTLMLVPTGPAHGLIETSFEVGPHSVKYPAGGPSADGL
jgi:hypothetical protein